MYQFNSACRYIENVEVDAEGFAGGVDQCCPEPFTCSEYGIAHGLVKMSRGLLAAGQYKVELVFKPFKPDGPAIFERICVFHLVFWVENFHLKSTFFFDQFLDTLLCVFKTGSTGPG